LTADRAISDHVVVQCPACGACESVEARALADRPAMVCRECGETWPAGGMRPKALLRPAARRETEGPLIVAEKQALVTYADKADKAWAAKIEGDHWPEPPRPRRAPMIAGAVASALFLALFFGVRPAAVTALPDLAGLYAAIGLPVNLDRLAIEGIDAERARTFDGAQVTVRATLRNLGKSERALPPLVAEVDGKDGALGTFGFDPPAEAIGGGQSLAVLVELAGLPESADSVALRLKRRGETVAIVGAAKLASE
jgi:hypothetical protein